MRSTFAIHRRSTTWAAVLLMALAVSAAPADTPIWSYGGCRVSGNTVAATFTNVSNHDVSGWVRVQAVVYDTPIWSSAFVFAKAGETVTVPVSFPGKVDSVMAVAISDSPTPL